MQSKLFLFSVLFIFSCKQSSQPDSTPERYSDHLFESPATGLTFSLSHMQDTYDLDDIIRFRFVVRNDSLAESRVIHTNYYLYLIFDEFDSLLYEKSGKGFLHMSGLHFGPGDSLVAEGNWKQWSRVEDDSNIKVYSGKYRLETHFQTGTALDTIILKKWFDIIEFGNPLSAALIADSIRNDSLTSKMLIRNRIDFDLTLHSYEQNNHRLQILAPRSRTVKFDTAFNFQAPVLVIPGKTTDVFSLPEIYRERGIIGTLSGTYIMKTSVQFEEFSLAAETLFHF